MTEPGAPTPLGALRPVAALVGLELFVAAVVLATGFVAVSDDDFSRVVIAERFVAAPSLDPSGTSWLPLPFVIVGTAMTLLGRSLGVARGVAVLEAAFSLVLVYRAARNVAASGRAAFASAALAALLPTAARLGVSFQPEALTAGLVVFGATSAARAGRDRVLGGIALGAATLCRYEAWPAALAFAAFGVLDSRKAGSLRGALAAILPGIVWMLHGVVTHGSALFFLHRVAAYRAALGETESVAAALLAYPVALLRAEPELVTLAVLVLSLAATARDAIEPALTRSARARAPVILGALFVFLVAGRLVGGAPTHHDERALISIYFGLSIFVAIRLETDVLGHEGRSGVRRRWVFGFLAALAGLAVLVRWFRPHGSSDRRAEIAIGTDARRYVGKRDRLLVDTGDYGYFAVIAAFGAPERAEPFDRRDPRDAPTPDPFTSAAALAARLSVSGSTWFVARASHVSLAAAVGTEVTRNHAFVLFSVNSTELSSRREH